MTDSNGTAFDPAAPSPRHSSASWITKNDTVYLFGGLGAPSYTSTDPKTALPPTKIVDGMHNDMWMYSFRTKTWKLASPTQTLNTNVPGRYISLKRTDLSLSEDDIRLEQDQESETDSNVDFAKAALAREDPISASTRRRRVSDPTEGTSEDDDSSLEGDKRELVLDVWPGARMNSATWVSPVDGSLWLFGGIGYASNNSAYGYLNDLWQFDIDNWQWAFRGGSLTIGTPDEKSWPGARTGATTWTTSGTLWLFSGYGPYEVATDNVVDRVRNDIWSFDLSSSTWTLVGGSSFYSTSAQLMNYDMTPRTNAIVWPDSGDGLIWVFGGYGTLSPNSANDPGYLNDLWAWNSTTLTWTTVSPANSLNVPGFIAESSGVSSPNNRPPSRCCAATWTDFYGRLYFFSGYGIANSPGSTADFVEDMWVLETASFFRDRAWTWVSGGTSKPPPAAVWAVPDDLQVIPSSPASTPAPVATNSLAPSDSDNKRNLSITTVVPFKARYKSVSKVDAATPSPAPGTPSLPPSSSPPNPLVSPGSRAWMNCWYSASTNEAFIFGSIGVNPRVSTSNMPAYFQDLWAFVLPARPSPPSTVPTRANERVSAIVWGIVGAEAALIGILLAIYFVFARRRKHDPEQDSEESTNSNNNSEMALLPPQSHYYDGLDGSYIPATTAYESHSNGYNRSSSPNSSVPSAYSSHSPYVVPGDGPPAAKYIASSSSRTSSNPSYSSAASYESATGSKSRSSSQGSGGKKGDGRRSRSVGLSNGHRVQRSSPNGVKAGVPQITASFDLVIKKSELDFGAIIGRGSSGTIYAGRWHEQRVAIKQLETDIILGGREGALEEAKLVSLIRPHPNVIQIFGVCVTKLHVFIVMSKMHSSLDKLIYHVQRRKWLTQQRMYKMAMGIVAGMLHLESQGICHRDLAARNVCLSKNGTPCITDFGMSRKLNFSASSAVGETHTQMGPVAWMAPECFHQKYSSKSDVWSFGIVLYEMMAGIVPHRGADLHQLAVAIRDTGVTPGPIPADADRGLVEIMKSCWAADPAERPTFAQISKRLHELSNADESEESESGQSKESSAKKVAVDDSHTHVESTFGRSNRTSIDTSRYPANLALLRKPLPTTKRKDEKSSNGMNGSASAHALSPTSNRLPPVTDAISSSTLSSHSTPSPTHSVSSVSSSTTISSSSVDSSSPTPPRVKPTEPISNTHKPFANQPPKPLGSGDYVSGF